MDCGFAMTGIGAHIKPMALLKIARMGNPVLRAPAAAVDDPNAPWVRQLVADMIETMEDAGGTGFAAPQVHQPWRIVVFFVSGERLSGMPGDVAQDLTVLINPAVELLGRERAFGWEGCLSVPGLRGVVPRHLRIRYRGDRPRRRNHRARGGRVSCPRRSARMRSPRRNSVSSAYRPTIVSGFSRRAAAPPDRPRGFSGRDATG